MWSNVHTAMLMFAGLAVLICIYRGNKTALVCALLSQVPFWGGFAWRYSAGTSPVFLNLMLDLTIGFTLLIGGHMTGKPVFPWLVLVLATMAGVDMWAISFGTNFYLLLHEVLHYTALVIAVGSINGGISIFSRHPRDLLFAGGSR